jgi:hypothetical protein
LETAVFRQILQLARHATTCICLVGPFLDEWWLRASWPQPTALAETTSILDRMWNVVERLRLPSFALTQFAMQTGCCEAFHA